jgi:hypothetical protein
MKAKVILLLVAIIAMSVLVQTTNAAACCKSSCGCVIVRCCSENVRFLKEDCGWKLSYRSKKLSFFETADYNAGIRGIRQVLSEEEVNFLKKGLQKAFSNGQKLFSINITIDRDTDNVLYVGIFLKDKRGKLSYGVHWVYAFRKNGNCLHVENDGEGYRITIPNSSGHIFISAFDDYRCANLRGFVSYFGIHDDRS